MPADAAHPRRWIRFTMLGAHYLIAALQEGQGKRGYLTSFTPGRMTLSIYEKPGATGQFTWSRPDPAHLLLQGTLDKKALTIKARLIPDSHYPLMARGFHWIQESPFNR